MDSDVIREYERLTEDELRRIESRIKNDTTEQIAVGARNDMWMLVREVRASRERERLLEEVRVAAHVVNEKSLPHKTSTVGEWSRLDRALIAYSKGGR